MCHGIITFQVSFFFPVLHGLLLLHGVGAKVGSFDGFLLLGKFEGRLEGVALGNLVNSMERWLDGKLDGRLEVSS